ncbi:MAG: DUF2341 domain-containing protein, partial [Bacteroidetes bacterium]|nr:DUF2341 domain-containing protein [Bacteroidota bacterium]
MLKKLFALLLIGISVTIFSKNPDAPLFTNSGWYLPITINNTNNPAALTDYTVLVTVNTTTAITQGKMNVDGSDIRFTTDFSNDLSYWIEPGIQNEYSINRDSTHIWVNLPMIAGSANTSLYMFYGNPTAAAKSNIGSTFLFGDDFDDNQLDSEKWELVYDNQGQIIEQNQRLEHNSPQTIPQSNSYLFSKPQFTGPIVLEMQFKKGGYIYRSVGLNTEPRGNTNVVYCQWQDWGSFSSGVMIDGVQSDVNFRSDYWSTTYNPEYYVKIIRHPDGTFSFSEKVPSFEPGGPQAWFAHPSSAMSLETTLRVFAYDGVWAAQSLPRYEDNIRVRKFSSPEPFTILSPEQTASSVTEYVADANTVMLDHFNGSTNASILAYRETGVACATMPTAEPNSSFDVGLSGLSQALKLNHPTGEPAGSSTYLKYPGGQLLSQPNGTIEFWLNLSSYGKGLNLVNQGQYYNACSGWTFDISIDSTGKVASGAWAAFSLNSGTEIVPLNSWTHIAVSWGSSGAKLYINGSLVGSDANTGMPASGYGGNVLMRLGTHTEVSTAIDELRISNIQRTSFNATSSQAISITSPNGGENLLVGSVQNITWTSTGVANVKLEYTTDNGTNWATIIASTPASSGSYAWTIPNTPSSQCKVRISDVANTNIFDESNNVFTIYQPTGSGFTEVFAGSLTGVYSSSVAWGDYDNDGDLDILLTGYNSSLVAISKIYQNTGSSFTEVFAGSLTGFNDASALWGDYDNDGDLDILLTGWTGSVG